MLDLKVVHILELIIPSRKAQIFPEFVTRHLEINKMAEEFNIVRQLIFVTLYKLCKPASLKSSSYHLD